MDKKFFKSIPFVLSSLLVASSLHAKSQTEITYIQTIIAQSCFFENASINYKEIVKIDDLLLVQAKNTDIQILKEKNLRTNCRSFRDISDEWDDLLKSQSTKLTAKRIKTFGSEFMRKSPKLNVADFKISYETEVNEILKSFDSQRMWNDLDTLTSFPNRAPNSATGMKAAEWFKNQAEGLALSAKRSDIKVEFIKTGNFYKQPSVVVTIPGTDPSLDGVLVGGHFDTLAGDMPGADDDGTGAVTVLETMRTILTSGTSFKRTLYFAWYSAEEQGLVGSKFVARYFKEKKIPLVGALQLDMTGYQAKPENKIYIVDDYVDASLSKFVSDLAVNYAKVEVAHTKCGYACSDHASWTANGYRSAMPFETQFGKDSPYIHTKNDTMTNVSLEHMNRFAIIGISFAGELAEPVVEK